MSRTLLALFATLSFATATAPAYSQAPTPASSPATTAPAPDQAATPAAVPSAVEPVAAEPPPPVTAALRASALDNYTPAHLAQLAADRINTADHRLQDFIYYDTEHNQNFIDGQLVVDHTTVSESIFIGGLPYLRKLSVDGHPLQGKELAQENKLYDKAVKDRTSLNEQTRARLLKHTVGNSSTDLDHLAAHFKLSIAGHQQLDGHDCLLLDAVPLSADAPLAQQRHIQIDIDTATHNVVNVRIEYLADDNGFDKGTVLNTRYHLIGGNTVLPYEQSLNGVVQVPQLLNRRIHVVKTHTYSNYRRFRATVTIEEVHGPPPPDTPQ